MREIGGKRSAPPAGREYRHEEHDPRDRKRRRRGLLEDLLDF